MSFVLHGLVGAHRTGKSTLAQALTPHVIDEYIPVGISAIQIEGGWDSSNQDYPWETRKEIQMHLLCSFRALLQDLTNRVHLTYLRHMRHTVTDRTPLDLIGYAMWSFPKDPSREDIIWMDEYVVSCIRLTNTYYDSVTVIQPGIPLVASDKSAAADEDMIDTFNQCYLGVVMNPYLKTKVHVMPRETTDLSERVTYMSGVKHA